MTKEQNRKITYLLWKKRRAIPIIYWIYRWAIETKTKFHAVVIAFFIKFFQKRVITRGIGNVIINKNNTILSMQDGPMFYWDPVGKNRLIDMGVNGLLEREDILLVGKMLHPGDTVIDIGANFGLYTLYSSLCVGKKGWVHAFEPQKQAYRWLTENIHLNNQKNITTNQVALGDTISTVKLYSYEGIDVGYSSLAKQYRGTPSVQTCPMTTLDKYISSIHHIKNVDFIKCDIEGAELLAFRGGVKTIESSQPIILFECVDEFTRNFGYSSEDLFHFLTAREYTIYVTDFNRLAIPKRYKGLFHKINTSFGFIKIAD